MVVMIYFFIGCKEKASTWCLNGFPDGSNPGSTVYCRGEAHRYSGDWKTMAFKAEVWVEAVTEGGRRFMAAWRKEEVDAARHCREKREATRLGKLQSHTEA